MAYALIPVKELPLAKARLAPVLDDAGRQTLALALFRDVLAAAMACPALDGIAVVTRDRDLLSITEEAGAEGLPEPGGLNEALTSASQTLTGRSVERLVVLAADLPLANADDIETVALADADVVVVRSPDGGTNALALAPGAIPFRFGPDSAQQHVDAAQEAGLRSLRLELPALTLDIDTPEDLARLRATAEEGHGLGAHTAAALEQLGLTTPPVRGG